MLEFFLGLIAIWLALIWHQLARLANQAEKEKP